MGSPADAVRSFDLTERVTKEIERRFDRIRRDWRPRVDDEGNFSGVMYGWGIRNGELRYDVTGAGEDETRFKEALLEALTSVLGQTEVRKAV